MVGGKNLRVLRRSEVVRVRPRVRGHLRKHAGLTEQRIRGGLVFKAHRHVYHSTLAEVVRVRPRVRGHLRWGFHCYLS